MIINFLLSHVSQLFFLTHDSHSPSSTIIGGITAGWKLQLGDPNILSAGSISQRQLVGTSAGSLTIQAQNTSLSSTGGNLYIRGGSTSDPLGISGEDASLASHTYMLMCSRLHRLCVCWSEFRQFETGLHFSNISHRVPKCISPNFVLCRHYIRWQLSTSAPKSNHSNGCHIPHHSDRPIQQPWKRGLSDSDECGKFDSDLK